MNPGCRVPDANEKLTLQKSSNYNSQRDQLSASWPVPISNGSIQMSSTPEASNRVSCFALDQNRSQLPEGSRDGQAVEKSSKQA